MLFSTSSFYTSINLILFVFDYSGSEQFCSDWYVCHLIYLITPWQHVCLWSLRYFAESLCNVYFFREKGWGCLECWWLMWCRLTSWLCWLGFVRNSYSFCCRLRLHWWFLQNFSSVCCKLMVSELPSTSFPLVPCIERLLPFGLDWIAEMSHWWYLLIS